LEITKKYIQKYNRDIKQNYIYIDCRCKQV
jgi:hypothetical protein